MFSLSKVVAEYVPPGDKQALASLEMIERQLQRKETHFSLAANLKGEWASVELHIFFGLLISSICWRLAKGLQKSIF